ncbi:MAG: hypothetical protein L0323_02260 [Planctomycetes bacterium]|nr:hypothetical protein [Planctomycetota bacterium]
MSDCRYCHRARGKRTCPALGGLICAACCGEHRRVEIACPQDCPYLGGERYQAGRRQERGVQKGSDYVRARLRLFPDEQTFAFAMEVEERIYRWMRVHEAVDEATVAGALDALQAALGTVVVASVPPHPLARALVEAARDPKGPFAAYQEKRAGARAGIVAKLAEDVRSRAGSPRRYVDLLRPFFDEVTDPRTLAAEMRTQPGERVSRGGIILP